LIKWDRGKEIARGKNNTWYCRTLKKETKNFQNTAVRKPRQWGIKDIK